MGGRGGRFIGTVADVGPQVEYVVARLGVLAIEPSDRDLAGVRAQGTANFRFMTIRKKFYATAWDGTIELRADLQGAYGIKFSEN